MRSWEADAESAGVTLAAESVLANNAPDDDALAKCKALGQTLC